MNWPSTVVGALAENRLLERLCFATLELLVASVLLASLVRWGRFGSIDPKGAGSPVTGPNDHFTDHSASLSALGTCTRIFTAHDPDDPFLKVAASQVVKDLPAISENKLSIDHDSWYFGTLALSQLDGSNAAAGKDDSWTPWSKAVVESLLALQDHTPIACTNGGWMVGDRWSHASGPLYTTAMNVLTLEIVRRSGAATGSAHKEPPRRRLRREKRRRNENEVACRRRGGLFEPCTADFDASPREPSSPWCGSSHRLARNLVQTDLVESEVGDGVETSE